MLGDVALRALTRDTLREILELDVEDSQKSLVASNAVSIAQAHFESDAWFRGIYAGDTPVGFVMLRDALEQRFCYVWRLMIDHTQQGKGYGSAAMSLIIDRARNLESVESIYLSHADRAGHAGPFYRSLGFVAPGEKDGDEIIMKYDL